MLATALFIAFWVVLGLVLFFIAIRGGLGGARVTLRTQAPGGRRILWGVIAIVYVGFGVAIPLAFLTGNHAKASSQVGGITLNAAEKRGRQLFGQNCGVCHTLAAANSVGKVGPEPRHAEAARRTRPEHDQQRLPSEPAAEQPAGLPRATARCRAAVEGKDARDVAAFRSEGGRQGVMAPDGPCFGPPPLVGWRRPYS